MNSDSLKIRKNFEFKGGRTITKERERERERERESTELSRVRLETKNINKKMNL